MPAWQKPDPAAEIGKLKREVEELSRIVRRGKPAPNMRDLADGSLSKAKDQEVPKYDAATGTWLPGSASGAPVAYFNNSTGALSGGYQSWNQVQTVGSRSWFQFPYGGTDKTRIKILSAGIFVVTFHATETSGGFAIELTFGSSGTIAHGSQAANSPAGAAIIDASTLAAAEQIVRAQTSGTATVVRSQLSITFYAGEPTFNSY